MKQKIKSLLFFKISTFILLTCICHFINDACIFNKFLDQKHDADRKSVTRTCRLLARHKKEKDSQFACLNEGIPNNRVYSEKRETEKMKQYNESSLCNARGNAQFRKTRSSVQRARCSSFEKRLMDKIYYKNKVRNTRNLDIKNLKEMVRNNYFLFFAFFTVLAGVALIVSYFTRDLGFVMNVGIKNFFIRISEVGVLSTFTFIVLLAFIYMFRKVVKNYGILKFKNKLYNTRFPSFN
ncbi:hypothetical protein MKS88_001035 [Plasmodium brasilianum]|uniref:Uncharacterized protein n=1 Tax=Plasmodium brasilianum TaxID=5824 RepID=A0ACB9YEF4_PLABR|nr:hypothetical protein MKS88_001035 [Plasmodium brasilianum]